MVKDSRLGYGVAAIIIRGGRLLLMKRKGAHAAGCWSVPGGWPDFGELSFQAVVREVGEEVGLAVSAQPAYYGFREEVHVDAPTKEGAIQSLTLYYTAETTGEPQIMEPEKIEAISWVALDRPDLWPKPLFPNLESVMHELKLRLLDQAPKGKVPAGLLFEKALKAVLALSEEDRLDVIGRFCLSCGTDNEARRYRGQLPCRCGDDL